MTRLANQRLAGILQSEIRAMTTACSGVKGINLAQGVCDSGVPEPVIRGAKQALDQGFHTYTRFDGIVELRVALAQK